ncbi:MAG TPA: FdhF/YdeP family oxidoreductase [Candidatus Dormibacteraeota bacterium]|nr:FdhF/YdeP family oxidoreductase [Candidatus Dormibacteraeota bacterium]
MTTKAPRTDPVDEPRVTAPEDWAAGWPAIGITFKRALDEMGVRAATKTLLKLNKEEGIDCPGCAWPDPDHRKTAEFCENGAKHVAAEATLRRVGADFFRTHSVSELRERSDWWLEEQGRLTEPLIKRASSDHYEPISWNDAVGVVADQLNALESPNQAVFYTSGRTSNEAAFIYGLFVRAFGTNNLPDCSNMCHESSGTALKEVIGIGKGTVTLQDLENAELIIICGQNPGTNHPRMLTSLEKAKHHGAVIVAVNPMPEAGLLRFRNPQTPRGLLTKGTSLADDYLPIRLAGDQALFLGVGKLLLEAEELAPGTVLDQDFIKNYTDGFEAYAASARQATWAAIEEGSGLRREQISKLADRIMAAQSVIIAWAMGLTQHKRAVPTIRELTNVQLLRGNIGRPGAGLLPVRGHSNVQGDRTMGISEKVPPAFLDKLAAEFHFEPAREPGWDSVDSVAAMRDGKARVLISLGGNLVRAISDTNVAEKAMTKLSLTVSIATKLNRSHVVTGDVALILPTLGRTERDLQKSGLQQVTVEDSMGAVHATRGVLAPASQELRSEISIICGLAHRTLGNRVPIAWGPMAHDYRTIRDHIAHVVPGCEDYNAKIANPAGFLLPHPPRDERRFATETQKARFSVNELQTLKVPPGRLLLQTVRSHDQFNTTIYSNEDRYRGIHDSRRVVLVNPEDLAELGLADGDQVDVFSEWGDDVERCLRDYRVVAYPTSRQCAAAYFPEANVLVPLESVAEGSNTPTSKSVVIRLQRHISQPAVAPALPA